MDELRLYPKPIAIAIRALMQYRGDFLTGILDVFVLTGVNIALIGILLSRFRSLQGWTF
jgi:ABC-2 type transport system permease protein